MDIGNIITICAVVFGAGGTIAYLKFQVKSLKEELAKREHEDGELWTAINKIRENYTDLKADLKYNIGKANGKEGE